MGSGEITGVVDPGLQSLVSVSRDDEIPDCRVGEEAGDLRPVSLVTEDWLEAVTEDRDPGPLTQHDPALTVRHNVPPRTGQTDLLHWAANYKDISRLCGNARKTRREIWKLYAGQ